MLSCFVTKPYGTGRAVEKRKRNQGGILVGIALNKLQIHLGRILITNLCMWDHGFCFSILYAFLIPLVMCADVFLRSLGFLLPDTLFVDIMNGGVPPSLKITFSNRDPVFCCCCFALFLIIIY